MTYNASSTISAPKVFTGSALIISASSATLNGTVNANGGSTTAWFNYGITSGIYTGTSTTQSVSGSSNTSISIGISGLASNTKYYYRIAASNSGGAAYGSEASFTTKAVSVTPTPTTTPAPTLPPLPTPQPSPSPVQEGIVFGFVNDEDAQALEGVTVKIERVLLAASQGQNILVQAASLNQQEENPTESLFTKGEQEGMVNLRIVRKQMKMDITS